MIKRYSLLLLVTIFALLAACKEDKRNQESQLTETIDATAPEKLDEPAKDDTNKLNSVMAKLMLTKECELFSRYLVTANLNDTLFNGAGPFTVFAPSNEAIDAIGSQLSTNLSQKAKKDSIGMMLKAHIVEGEFTTVTMVQRLKTGNLRLKSLSGAVLTVSKIGTAIFIANSRGEVAELGKTDIEAGNGVVHVVNAFLGKY